MSHKSTIQEILSIIEDIFEEIAEMKAILRGEDLKKEGDKNGGKSN